MASSEQLDRCRSRLPQEVATELSAKTEDEQAAWLRTNCDEVSLTFFECQGSLTKLELADYELVPPPLRRTWLRSHCQAPVGSRLAAAPLSGPPPRGVLAMVGASGAPAFTDDDRTQMHELVRVVLADALRLRQIAVVAATERSAAPCDRAARVETAQATAATTVLCFHTQAQGQDTVVAVALYDAISDRLITSSVVPVAGAHVADIAYPLRQAALNLVSGNQSPQTQASATGTMPTAYVESRHGPRKWVAMRVTGSIVFAVGVANLAVGLALGGVSEFEEPQTWVPSLVAGGVLTFVGGVTLSTSELRKRRVSASLIPTRDGAIASFGALF